MEETATKRNTTVREMLLWIHTGRRKRRKGIRFSHYLVIRYVGINKPFDQHTFRIVLLVVSRIHRDCDACPGKDISERTHERKSQQINFLRVTYTRLGTGKMTPHKRTHRLSCLFQTRANASAKEVDPQQ